MYILSEADYSRTNWYKRILSPMKAEARRKRIPLFEGADVRDLPVGESVAFVVGGSEGWILDTVHALQERTCHPILLGEIDSTRLTGRFSRVGSDYEGLVRRLTGGGGRFAFYGVNPASASDAVRRQAFLSVLPESDVFENNGSLCDCFEAFWSAHTASPFDCVLCANDLAAVSLHRRLEETGKRGALSIAVQASGAILSFFPSVQAISVDPMALSQAAFEIADCIRAHPDFIGMTIFVGFSMEGDSPIAPGKETAAVCDPFYADPEMAELLRLDRLLSSLDETDLKILSLLSRDCRDIGEEAYLSDNGVKYRLKKMKRLCGVESKREIPVLLGKYGIKV